MLFLDTFFSSHHGYATISILVLYFENSINNHVDTLQSFDPASNHLDRSNLSVALISSSSSPSAELRGFNSVLNPRASSKHCTACLWYFNVPRGLNDLVEYSRTLRIETSVNESFGEVYGPSVPATDGADSAIIPNCQGTIPRMFCSINNTMTF